jgi:phage host-nuclease inhibitor protein Gam
MDARVEGTVVKAARPPKALWEVSGLLRKLASNVFAELRIRHSYKVKISDLEKERDQKVGVYKFARQEIVGKIFEFVKERVGEFGTTKSVIFATGEVGFRKAVPSVEIAPGYTEKGVVAKFLKRHRKYLRFTPKLNREKILQDYHDAKFKSIKGIQIAGGGEEFFISLAPRKKEKPEVITVPMEQK